MDQNQPSSPTKKLTWVFAGLAGLALASGVFYLQLDKQHQTVLTLKDGRIEKKVLLYSSLGDFLVWELSSEKLEKPLIAHLLKQGYWSAEQCQVLKLEHRDSFHRRHGADQFSENMRQSGTAVLKWTTDHPQWAAQLWPLIIKLLQARDSFHRDLAGDFAARLPKIQSQAQFEAQLADITKLEKSSRA